MPVIVDSSFPDFQNLASEGLVCTPDSRAARQGVPLELGVYNSMPNKARTAADIARLLGASGHPVRLTFLRPEVMEACEHDFIEDLKYKPAPYAAAWHRHFRTYQTCRDVSGRRFHGMVTSGAPLGGQPVETLKAWPEWCRIFDSASSATGSVLAICLSAMGAAQYLLGVRKETLLQKLSGVYPQQIISPQDPLVQGLGHTFPVPVSRYSRLPERALASTSARILAGHAETGAGLLRLSADVIGLTVHPEYTHDTLHAEYCNALKSHAAQPHTLAPRPPVNYYHHDDPAAGPRPNGWKQAAHILGANLVREIREKAMSKGLLVLPETGITNPVRAISRTGSRPQPS